MIRMSAEEEITTGDSRNGEAEVPLCLRCLRPLPENIYYCPYCGHVANTLTPYLPFINIPFYTRFYGDCLKALKSPTSSKGNKTILFVVIVAILVGFAPLLPLLLLVKLFHLVFTSWSKKPQEHV